jgi:hypothetical protein
MADDARAIVTRQIRHRATAHMLVVEQHGDTVSRHAHVGLDAVYTGAHGCIECLQRVPGEDRVVTALCEDEHAGERQ